MPSLAQLQGTTLTQVVNSAPIIEPLDGPTSVEDLYDHFPPEVYQQGRDTHLYRLLAALNGDAGAGFLKTQAFQLRLKFEAELISADNLNQTYGHQFQLSRLSDETYSFDPDVDQITPAQVDIAALADQSYYHRAQEFFTASRYGNSPLGMATTAQAGSGIPTDIVEHYKWIFDQYSDLPLGLSPLGHTTSTSEFVLLVRLLAGDFPTREWNATNGWTFTFTAPVLNAGVGRPVTLTTPITATRVYSTAAQTELVPEVERNVVDLLDKMRPASTLATIAPYTQRYSNITLNEVPFASSERILMSRFVTGSSSTSWPDVDPSQGYFIEGSVENEATSSVGIFPELPVVFHTIDHVVSYTDHAIGDLLYGLDEFYSPGTTGLAPVANYVSQHVGTFFLGVVNIFPILSGVSSDTQFYPTDAIATQNTLLRLNG